MSPRSTISTLMPASAASRAIAAPLIPAPTTISSYSFSALRGNIVMVVARPRLTASRAWQRCERAVSAPRPRCGRSRARRKGSLAAMPLLRCAGSRPSRADLAGAADDVFVARELGGADGPARVNLARGDADLRAHAELAAVGELRRRVVHDDRAVELVQEALGGCSIVRDDRVR